MEWMDRGFGHHPELSERVVNERDCGSLGWSDVPTPAQKVDLVVGVYAALQMERQMQIEQR
jgi:hypothetical protein